MYLKVSELLAVLARMNAEGMDVAQFNTCPDGSVKLVGYVAEDNRRSDMSSGYEYDYLPQVPVRPIS